MKDVVDSLLAFVPFLQRYPAWVKVLFLVWLACSFSLVAAFVFAKAVAKPEKDSEPRQQAAISTSTNSTIYQAGRDIVISNPRWEDAVANGRDPLTFHAAVYPGPPYPPGTRIGTIDWLEQFSDVRLDLGNQGDVDVEEIDLVIQTDQSIAGVAQISNIPNVIASPEGNMPPSWLEGTDERGSAVSIPIIPTGTVMTGSWRLYCPKLLKGSAIHLVVAAVSLTPVEGGRLPREALRSSAAAILDKDRW